MSERPPLIVNPCFNCAVDCCDGLVPDCPILAGFRQRAVIDLEENSDRILVQQGEQ